MKICAYAVREDEQQDFARLGAELGAELVLCPEEPGPKNADRAAGCTGITVLGGSRVGKALLDAWRAAGVRYLSTRTIGYDHIDVAYAHKCGMRVCNADYPPSGVAEYTVMLMLLCLRKYKQALWRGQINDFSLAELQGRELGSLTVGIMGTGRIGQEVIKILSGFGCKILAYAPHPKENVRHLAEYVDLDTFYGQCDLISLHMPLTQATYHLIDREAIANMKDGVVLINCARGAMAAADALIEGIESGKIGALGLDVLEGEEGINHVNHRDDILINRGMAYLRQFKNVVMTPHMAFYTDIAVTSMVRTGLQGLLDMARTGTCATEIGG